MSAVCSVIEKEGESMKKVYSKPALYAETFELVEHVAGDCIVNDGFAGALHRGPESCGYRDSNITLFTGDLSDCADAAELFALAGASPSTDLSVINMECYNSFLSGNLFAS